MATRARNEGSIYRQQTDGRWVAAISVGYRNGRRRRKKWGLPGIVWVGEAEE